MSLGKVHKLKPAGTESRNARYGARETFCGFIGTLCSGFSSEFNTDIGGRFEATDSNNGVTCSRCRKSRWPRTDDAMAAPMGRTG